MARTPLGATRKGAAGWSPDPGRGRARPRRPPRRGARTRPPLCPSAVKRGCPRPPPVPSVPKPSPVRPVPRARLAKAGPPPAAVPGAPRTRARRPVLALSPPCRRPRRPRRRLRPHGSCGRSLRCLAAIAPGHLLGAQPALPVAHRVPEASAQLPGLRPPPSNSSSPHRGPAIPASPLRPRPLSPGTRGHATLPKADFFSVATGPPSSPLASLGSPLGSRDPAVPPPQAFAPPAAPPPGLLRVSLNFSPVPKRRDSPPSLFVGRAFLLENLKVLRPLEAKQAPRVLTARPREGESVS